jgi:signal peptidase II
MLKWLYLSLAVIILDQATKMAVAATMPLYESIVLVPGCFNLTHVHNTGAAFSFLSQAGGWQRWFFAGLAVIVSGSLSLWLARLNKHEFFLAAAIALILGGAIGNLIDRLAYGYVIDFLDVYYQSLHWPAFNIADSAITIGVGMLILESLGIGRGTDKADL